MAQTNADVTFREDVHPADRPQIQRIVRDTKFFREDEVAVAMELVDDRLAKGAASDYKFIVAERGGRVVGFANYGLIACTVHSYDLYWIVVDPAAQGGGIGRRLMTESEARIHALGGKRVYVETSNKPQYEPTRQFYLKCNYTIEAVLKEFYAPGDDKVIFVKAV